MLGIAKINEVFFIVAKRNRENKCSWDTVSLKSPNFKRTDEI